MKDRGNVIKNLIESINKLNDRDLKALLEFAGQLPRRDELINIDAAAYAVTTCLSNTPRS